MRRSALVRAMPGSGPIPPAERVELLDALRGLAILGIFVINLHAFGSGSGSASDRWRWEWFREAPPRVPGGRVYAARERRRR